MEKNREVTGAVGADNQRGTCGTRRWRGVERAGRDERDAMVRWLSAQGHSRRTIAGLLGISMAAVARAQRVTS
jgi:hypothetical protein